MPKNPSWSIGSQKKGRYNTEKCFETYPTFLEIKYDTKTKLPPCQGSLDNEKVNQMVAEFIKDPTAFFFKDTITIGVLNNTPWLMDGQHRLEMVKVILEYYSETDPSIEKGTFRFCYKKVADEKELRDLFNSVNQDSIKNRFYLNQDNFTQIKMDEFTNYLKSNFKKHFAKSKLSKNTRYKYTIPEFVELLQKKGFFNNDKSVAELGKDLQRKNDIYYQKNYPTNIEKNPSIFYDLDRKQIESKIIFSLVRNNFIDSMLSETIDGDDTPSVPFFHEYKKHKKNISRALKLKCWNKHYIDKIETTCPMKNCEEIMIRNETGQWDAGHIISEKNGGKVEINNLRPICKRCNKSMSSKNWDDYVAETEV
jgi:hypothetical protein